MNHVDCINLIKGGVSSGRQVWAEFGSGNGAFTLALAELIATDGTIYSVDLDSGALNQQKKQMEKQFPDLEVHYKTADFTKPIDLPKFDGILMANALHFVKGKESFISKIKDYIQPEGQLLIVEYNIDRGNRWVPYPISLESWKVLAKKCGFHEIRFLGKVPSRYHKEVYSAVSFL